MSMMHAEPASRARYYGKYRGKVLDNVDPLLLGRILAEVASVPGMTLNWCMPCTPYAGNGVGFYAIPPIGANVWIEFEEGNPDYPIWAGCFWAEGEVPLGTEEPPNPLVKVFKTAFATFVMNDTPEVGGITIECHPEAVTTPLSMTFDSTGITILAPPAIIKMITAEGITLTYPPDVIEMSEDTITIAVPPSTIAMTSEAIVATAPALDATAEGVVTIEAGGEASIEAGGAINLGAGLAVAIEAGLDVNVAAAAAVSVEAAADISLTGATVLITGVTEVTGALTVDGMIPVLIPA